MSLTLEQIPIHGITIADIQKIVSDTIKECRAIAKILYLDVNYLYSFDIADLYYIYKFTDMIREDSKLAEDWLRYLEIWYSGQSVNLFGVEIKPLQITRTFDRVPNEFMEMVAQIFVGQGPRSFDAMKFHAVGDGATVGATPSPADTTLQHEVDRIDVTLEAGGGGITRRGSTFFCIGNHDTFMESATITETGIFDRDVPNAGAEGEPIIDDRMGDHSIFPSAVDHNKGQNAIGSTTVIFQCSS